MTATTKIQVTADDGTEITLVVPVGMPEYPTDRAEAFMASVEDKTNWKGATSLFETTWMEEAEELAYALDFYLGGHEESVVIVDGIAHYLISSRGYYHYIGA